LVSEPASKGLALNSVRGKELGRSDVKIFNIKVHVVDGTSPSISKLKNKEDSFVKRTL